MPAHPHLGWVNPVIGHDSADPGVFYDKVSHKYYCFTTNSNGKNIQCSYSDDMMSWTHHDQDCLPGPFPPWTGQPGFFWAPEVIEAPQNRPGYLMYTSCQDKSTGKQCIGVAYTQGGPLGPYKFISHGPIVSRGETGGTIDPQPFVDPPSGKRYLVYKNDLDKMYTKGNQLWIQELSEDGLEVVGERTGLQAPHASYQGSLLEAPYLTHHQPSGTYCLFYSSGTFTTDGYATSYSHSKHLLGPYKPSGQPLLYTDKARGIQGPGGACVIQGVEGNWFIIFHSLEHFEGPRRTCMHRLEWTQEGHPVLPGRPCEGHRIRLGAEEEDDEACGLKAKAGPAPTFKASGGGGDKLKDGLQKFMNALK